MARENVDGPKAHVLQMSLAFSQSVLSTGCGWEVFSAFFQTSLVPLNFSEPGSDLRIRGPGFIGYCSSWLSSNLLPTRFQLPYCFQIWICLKTLSDHVSLCLKIFSVSLWPKNSAFLNPFKTLGGIWSGGCCKNLNFSSSHVTLSSIQSWESLACLVDFPHLVRHASLLTPWPLLTFHLSSPSQ